MAHLIETMVRASDTAQSWHGKENIIPHDAPFDQWFDGSGLNYKVLRSKVRYCIARDPQVSDFLEMPSRHVLFRSDTLKPLAVVSEDYRVVQPRSILEFYRDLCETNKLKMDTAGVLAGGKRVWALARTGNEIVIGNADVIKQYVLLATSYDTSMATIAKHTSVRVVCNNTLTLASNNSEAAIRVPHSADFDPTKVQLDLGLLETDFTDFCDDADELHRITLTPTTAAKWYAQLLLDLDTPPEDTDPRFLELHDNRVMKGLLNSYVNGPGAEATAWGWVNGVTHMVDHIRGRGYDTRMNAAWFGAGDALKRKAWELARSTISYAAVTSKGVTV